LYTYRIYRCDIILILSIPLGVFHDQKWYKIIEIDIPTINERIQAMFFDRITLKRNGWYTKVLCFVFPNAPKYDNFCPFFWLTIIALFCAPFKALALSIWIAICFLGACFVRFGDAFATGIDNIIKASIERKFMAYSPEELAKAKWTYEHKSDWYYGADKLYAEVTMPPCEVKRYIQIWRWVIKQAIVKLDHDKVVEKLETMKPLSLEEWTEKRRQWKVEWEARKTKEHAEEKERTERNRKLRIIREERNKKLYAKTINIGKVIVPIILIPVVIWLGYYAFFGFGWLFYWIWYGLSIASYAIFTFFWNYWASILVILGGTAIICLFTWGLFVLISKLSTSNIVIPRWLCLVGQVLRKFFCWIGRGLKHFANGIIWCGSGIGSIFNFFWMFFLTFKQNNCPHIDWTD
jgi:hypothetical protein